MDVALEQAPRIELQSTCDTHPAPQSQTTFLIAARKGHPVAAGFAAYLERQIAPCCHLATSPEDWDELARELRKSAAISDVVVVFLDSHDTARNLNLLKTVEDYVDNSDVRCVGVVSTFRVHFDDQRAAQLETQAVQRFEGKCNRLAVFRSSHILAAHCPARVWLRRLSFLHPLVPRRFKSCCVEGDELFASLSAAMKASESKPTRTYTLLGPNQPWRNWLAAHQSAGWLSKILVGVCTVLKFLLVGQLAGLILDAAIRLNPRLRRLNFDTLQPKSTRELLTLYNPFNCRHLKVVGYNNGVVHFGWRFPGRTIVSTIHAASVAQLNGSIVKLDAGVTIRRVRDVLDEAGKELYVIPNYSYVSIGTSFFIPIHGSASRYSTVGDTIERVVLYDPKIDRVVVAARGEAAFGEYIYNLDRSCLLLRLRLRVKDKSAYFVKSSTLEKPSGQQVLDVFDDTKASNIELRKATGDSETVQVCKYYTQASDDPGATGGGDLLEVPRDSIGRIWDKLEENRLASVLHHFFVRTFAYHVELFFSRDEFIRFWNTHGDLPIKKIQLRYIKRDSLPHSPFRDHDCISADLFTFKKHRDSFQAYLRENFPQVQVNPGKHSM